MLGRELSVYLAWLVTIRTQWLENKAIEKNYKLLFYQIDWPRRPDGRCTAAAAAVALFRHDLAVEFKINLP